MSKHPCSSSEPDHSNIHKACYQDTGSVFSVTQTLAVLTAGYNHDTVNLPVSGPRLKDKLGSIHSIVLDVIVAFSLLEVTACLKADLTVKERKPSGTDNARLYGQ